MAVAIEKMDALRRRALVVDDSRLACTVLTRMLERQGFEVQMAGSAGEALARLRTERPDVIFLDHLMAGLSGLEALKLIKSNPELVSLPVVMYTSQESAEFEAAARAAGASGVLSKHIDRLDLPRLLESLGLLSAVPVRERRATTSVEPATVTPLAQRRSVPTGAPTARATQVIPGRSLREAVAPLLDRQREQLRAELLAEFAILESHEDRLSRGLIGRVDTLVERIGRTLREDLAEQFKRARRWRLAGAGASAVALVVLVAGTTLLYSTVSTVDQRLERLEAQKLADLLAMSGMQGRITVHTDEGDYCLQPDSAAGLVLAPVSQAAGHCATVDGGVTVERLAQSR